MLIRGLDNGGPFSPEMPYTGDDMGVGADHEDALVNATGARAIAASAALAAATARDTAPTMGGGGGTTADAARATLPELK